MSEYGHEFDGLGFSSTSQQYSIKSVAEAEAYLRHPILGPRLLESARATLGVEGRSALEVFGSPDDMKLRSSATLFASVSPAGSVFGQLLDRYFGGEPDDRHFDCCGKSRPNRQLVSAAIGRPMSKIPGFTVLLLVALVAAGACARPPRSTVEVPDKLKPGANESLAMIVAAKGVQIYECRARKDQTGEYEWAFVAPEADLFDARGSRIGPHYAGPHWESTDGSKIVGTVKERADAPVTGAIPWLLLAARSIGPAGSFSKVTSIQRVNTVGGVAPASGCSQAAAGTPARIGYTADYYFFATK